MKERAAGEIQRDSEVLAAITALQVRDLPTRGGRTLAYVYDSGVPGLDELATAAYASAMNSNALDPTAFPSLPAMEGDLVATAAALLGGGPTTVGTVTSGGTESCMLAVAAARDGAPHITAPRMVIASSAHAAFHKAAHYFGVTIDMVDVDPVTLRANPAAMEAAIGPNTVLVVASAPSYAHGVIDPITPIAAAAAERGVRCHVDACIGGWILGSWRRFGVVVGQRPLPPFDLAVPGVTSISVDLHKYAYTPKGASVLLHASAELRASQYFVETQWPGYAMLNTTLQSTRSGGPIAAAWAVVKRLGDSGYRDIAVRTASAVEAISRGVAAIDGLRLLAEPDATLIAVATAATEPADGEPASGPNVFAIADEMAARGYYIQPQFAFRGVPASLHMTVTAANAGNEAELIAALAQSVDAAAAVGDPSVGVDVIEAVLQADLSAPGGLVAVASSLGLIGDGGSLTLPQRMAPINALLDALPAASREQVLRGVLSLLTAPGRSLLD
ncbi:MAG: aminotransferase class V-fold PLP-dependent enzyme [Nakamurella sp.]